VSSEVFSSKDADLRPSATHLTIEDSRIREMVSNIPLWAPEQLVPLVNLEGLTGDISGYWSLWKISGYTDTWHANRFIPVFLHHDGRVLMPTARRIWELLLSQDIEIANNTSQGNESNDIHTRLHAAAEKECLSYYQELVSKHTEFVRQKNDNKEYSFSAMRRAVERIGLPEVRMHRLMLIEKEQQKWESELMCAHSITPALVCLLILQCKGAG
jgi:hypothetical protein